MANLGYSSSSCAHIRGDTEAQTAPSHQKSQADFVNISIADNPKFKGEILQFDGYKNQIATT